MQLDLDPVRAQFPALALSDHGRRRIYFDNPAGTQVPRRVVEAMNDCLYRANANLGGPFASSRAAGAIVDGAHQAMADLLHAADPAEIVFGANMTTLTLYFSRVLGRELRPGDEIVVTELDHDANVTPWVLLARDLGLRVRKLPLDTSSYRLDLGALDEIVTPCTRLVCVGHASNLLGTINDVSHIAAAAHRHGALVFVDAVHSVPHLPVDVQALGCDLLACSPYKFFGPHAGVVWGRRELLERLDAYKLRPAPDSLPGRYETGTQSHEAMAGVTAAVDYLASLAPAAPSRRARLADALARIQEYESELCRVLLDGLAAVPGLVIYGITDELSARAPTVAFRMAGHAPAAVVAALAARNIFAWDGHSYAVEPCAALGLLDRGGVVRVGIVHYNTREDIEALLAALHDLAR